MQVIDRTKRASLKTLASGSSVVGARVVVIGVNFAPESTGIAPYTTDLCEHLATMGASVHMITGVPHYPTWTIPHAYRRRACVTEVHGAVRVTRARHYVPRSQTPLRRALFEGSFIVSSSLASRSVKADIVLAVTPNLGALPVAAAIARRNRAPLGVIVQDLIGQAASQSGMRAAMPMAGLIGRLEARWLRAADVVGVVSRGFVGPLVAGGLDESRLVHLPNYTHVVPAPNGKVAARRALGWPVESFYVVHTGNMGFKQDLSNVIASARLAQEAAPSMRFMFVGDGSQRAAVEKSSRGLKNVMLSPVLSSADYPLALAAADVLLVNERPTVKDMSLPSKLTSYFAAGRPILAATRADGATAEEVHRAGGGVVVTPGNPAALLQKLQLLAGDDELRAKLARTGRNYSEANLSRVEGRNRIIEFVAQLTHFDANPDVRGAGGE